MLIELCQLGKCLLIISGLIPEFLIVTAEYLVGQNTLDLDDRILRRYCFQIQSLMIQNRRIAGMIGTVSLLILPSRNLIDTDGLIVKLCAVICIMHLSLRIDLDLLIWCQLVDHSRRILIGSQKTIHIGCSGHRHSAHRLIQLCLRQMLHCHGDRLMYGKIWIGLAGHRHCDIHTAVRRCILSGRTVYICTEAVNINDILIAALCREPVVPVIPVWAVAEFFAFGCAHHFFRDHKLNVMGDCLRIQRLLCGKILQFVDRIAVQEFLHRLFGRIQFFL